MCVHVYAVVCKIQTSLSWTHKLLQQDSTQRQLWQKRMKNRKLDWLQLMYLIYSILDKIRTHVDFC